jgi:hypothetical protein
MTTELSRTDKQHRGCQERQDTCDFSLEAFTHARVGELREDVCLHALGEVQGAWRGQEKADSVQGYGV